MSWIGDLRKAFSEIRGKKNDHSNDTKSDDTSSLETRQEKKSKVVTGAPDGGRSSLKHSDFWDKGFGGLKGGFAKKDLAILDYLANKHHHVAKAVANIIFLASTKFNVTFGAKVSARQAERMRRFISGRSYATSGTNRTLINDLYRQLGTYGAISAEIALDMKGKMPVGVDEVVGVDNQEIDYEVKDKKYVFFQEDPNRTGGKRYLNKLTYCYSPLWTDGKSPLGIPPMLAALRMLGVEDKLINKMEDIGHKLDLFGFMVMKMKKPEPEEEEEEDDESYLSRLREFQRQETQKLENRASSGVAAVFEDDFEFDILGNKLNAEQLQDLKKVIDTDLLSGLKQDGFLFGQGNSTTETLARVVLAIMVTMVISFQHMVEDFLSYLIYLDLILHDFKVDKVYVEFDEPLITDQQRKQTVRSKMLDNVEREINLGFISRTKGANMMGHDEPFESDEEYNQRKARERKEEKISPSENDNSNPDTGSDLEPSAGTAPDKEVSV